tara:strand:+ start:17426 stop:17917 length:492 start_codon:yes stop_codon:yes gene_type:complete
MLQLILPLLLSPISQATPSPAMTPELASEIVLETPAVVEVVVPNRDLLVTEDDGRGTPYRVDKDDNICGLDEPRQLSKPAKVDYSALVDETPELKEIVSKGIDKTSAKGIELMAKARRRVLTACETVRGNKGNCSVWKQIARRDGKAIDDLTTEVKAEIQSSK